MKPDCYKCKHRRDIPGDAHSSCAHPSLKVAADNPLLGMLAIFASVGRVDPIALQALGVTGDSHGIKNGWFNWPWNFDPTWLKTCKGFEQK